MSLDAFVYCDCFEKDNLRCDPPRGVMLKVASNGELTCDNADESSWMAFQAWKLTKACLHEGMILVRHRMGNDERIDVIRRELERTPEHYPILLRHVVYSSTHTCDWIPIEWLPSLIEEVKFLNPAAYSEDVSEALLHFKIQIAELIIASQLTHKPICF